MVADINPGAPSSNPSDLMNINGTLFFIAVTSQTGGELWKSDGTASGTTLVKDIRPGAASSMSLSTADFTNLNGTLYFFASDGAVAGGELWKSDGSANGTVMVSAFAGKQVTGLANANGTLYFSVGGADLWRSDGTTTGTVFVTHIDPDPDPMLALAPRGFTYADGKVFFGADDAPNRLRALWETDGTAAGTNIVRDFNPPLNLPAPASFFNYNGKLFFGAEDSAADAGLWTSDGTAAGTFLVRAFSGLPLGLTNVNGTLFFRATDAITGPGLWKTDGTAAGTVLLHSFSALNSPMNVNGTLFFSADNGTTGLELWKSDGTTAGTVLVSDINPGPTGSLPASFAALNGLVYFSANDGVHGPELWQSDGTAAGTVLVQDINAGPNGSNPIFLTNVNGTLFFAADDGVHGKELWKVANAPSITITNAFVVNSHLQAMTPDIGEEVFIHAYYSTQGLPTNASYRISYTIDGVTLYSKSLSYGAGASGTPNFDWVVGGWFASPGVHNVTVSVAPVTYLTTSKSFSFTPVSAPDLPAKFLTPLGGTPFQTWGIVNYVDVNPLTPAFQDYNGGNYTYDGHTGHDMTLSNFGLMDDGVPDYAAAAGTVVAVQDGNFDRNTASSNAPANFVEIDHGNGWHTLYYHLRTDTILVHVGDRVVAGQVLGLAGSSGDSTAAHLHFEVQHNGDIVEPEYDPNTFWVNALPYQGSFSNILDSGVTSSNTTAGADLNAEERPVAANIFTQAGGQAFTVWFQADTRNNDNVAFQFYKPDGTLYTSLGTTFSANQSRWGYWWYFGTLPSNLNLGTWHVGISINGTQMALDSFQITAGGAGAAHLTQGTTYVPNGRTTPLDFGTVNPGAAPPTQTFTVSNLGSATLTLSNLALPSGFSLVGQFPGSVAVGGTATFTLQMDTGASGSDAGIVQFNTSDPHAPAYSFAVKGTVSGGNTGAIHGQVFQDINGDGIENGLEGGIVGWTVSLINPADNTVLATTTTGYNGYYEFLNLAPGSYRVRETRQGGWTQTTPNPADITVATANVLASPFGVAMGLDAPVSATAVAVPPVTEGQQFTGEVATFTDADPAAPLTDFPLANVTINWGDGSTSHATAITQPGGSDTPFQVFGSHTYTEEGTTAHPLQVSIQDVGGAVSNTTGSPITVQDAILAASGTAFTAAEGTSLVATVATFTDANPNPDLNDFASVPNVSGATIDWGDGTTSNALVRVNGNGGYDVVGVHAYAEAATYTITVTIRDAGGQSVTANSTATITELSLTPTNTAVAVTEGVPFSGLVASFTDANPIPNTSDFSATIDWGDGATSSATSIKANSNGGFDVYGTHTYAEESTSTVAVSVVISDGGNNTAPVISAATIGDGALTPLPATITPTEEKSFSGVVASFTDANGSPDLSDFSATIDWGNGTPVPADSIQANSTGGFDVYGTHTYLEEGTQKGPTVTITDKGGSSTTVNSIANVADASLATGGRTVCGTAGAALHATMSFFVDPGTDGSLADYGAAINWGDGSPLDLNTTITTLPGSFFLTFAVLGSHTYAQPGSYLASILLTDAGGSTATATSQVLITPARGQPTNVDVSNWPGYQGETTIAINPTNPLNMIAGSNDLNGTTGLTRAYWSMDGGQTWTGVDLGNKGDPAVAFDRSGNAYFTYLAGDGSIGITKSTDGGRTWSPSADVAPPPSGGFFDKDYLAIGPDRFNPLKDRLYVAWDSTSANDQLEVASSLDGVTWTAPTVVDGGNSEIDAAPVVGPSGELYLAWQNFSISGQARLMVNVSLDDGATFGSDVLAATSNVNSFIYGGVNALYTIPAQPSRGIGPTPSLAVDLSNGPHRGRLYLSYTAAKPGQPNDTDIKLVASDNGGKTWTALGATPLTINDDGTAASQFFPALAVDPTNGWVNLAWYDARNDPCNDRVDVYFTRSYNGGQTFIPNRLVTDLMSDESDPVLANPNQFGDYLGLAAYGGGAQPVWTDTRNGPGNEEVYTQTIAPDAALHATGTAITATEGSAFTAVVASFTDGDPKGTVADFTATINWGDGSSSAGVVTPHAGGGFDVSGTHLYAEAGSYALAVTVTDFLGSSANAASTASVADAALTLTGTPLASTEGALFSGAVGSFTDANPSAAAKDFTATIAWGDGQTSSGTVQANASGGFQVRGSHTYAEEGTYSVVVTLQDVGGSRATGTGLATVTDAALTATGTTLSAIQGATFTGVAATFTDADPGGKPTDYTATIAWGDGASSTGTISVNGNGGFNVVGSHVYSQAGGYAVTVTIHDAGSQATANSTASVAAGNVFKVTNVADSGPGSLRQALLDANATPGVDVVAFNIPGSGVQTIQPLTRLPIITVPLILDGATQPGFAGTPIIQLDGSQETGGSPDGLVLFAGNCTVRGFVINRFATEGIIIEQNGGNVIQGNYIGTDATGTQALGNYGAILIDSSGNLVGTNGDGVNDAGERNVISGNRGSNGGVLIDSNQNIVAGNYIGTDVTGTQPLGNTFGVAIVGTGQFNVIGTDGKGSNQAAKGNVISGNLGNGVVISQASNNVVAGNYVGTDAMGMGPLGNADNGIYLVGASSNTVGGTAPGAGNVISGNSTTALYGSGVFLSGSTSNLVQGNLIGTDMGGQYGIGNAGYGVAINNGATNIIGGTTAAARNVISRNGLAGVSVFGNTTGNLVEGNFIGTDREGTLALGNASGGVQVGGGAANNIVGGTAAGAGNLISGNGSSALFGAGVTLFGAGTTGNLVQGNLIGTDVTGAQPLGNYYQGVTIESSASLNTIGGTTAGAGNVIAFNPGDGVLIYQDGTGNRISQNSIHSNGGLGINLEPVGEPFHLVTPNHSGGSQGGPNNLQNYPVLTGVVSASGATTVSGSLNSTANTTFTLEFFSDTVLNPSGYGEGEAFLGSIPVTTDANGNVTFQASFPMAVPAGQFVTATATDPGNNTSEFSQGQPVASPPPPAAAGAPYSSVLASFTDTTPGANPSEFSAAIAWGDGSTSAGTITTNGQGVFNVSGTHTYLAVGTYAVLVTTTDVDGGTTTTTNSVSVAGLGLGVQKNQTEELAYWNTTAGQAMINSFNGGRTATALASWLASNFPNLYGAGAGGNDLTGKTNADVAALFHRLYGLPRPRVDAQVLATALSVYATTSSLGGTTAAGYGFVVTADGLGANSFNIGVWGQAFGVPNKTTLNVFQMLKAVDKLSAGGKGVLYKGDTGLRLLGAETFEDLNEFGDA
jgi:ELWxxDGT repeat protein